MVLYYLLEHNVFHSVQRGVDRGALSQQAVADGCLGPSVTRSKSNLRTSSRNAIYNRTIYNSTIYNSTIYNRTIYNRTIYNRTIYRSKWPYPGLPRFASNLRSFPNPNPNLPHFLVSIHCPISICILYTFYTYTFVLYNSEYIIYVNKVKSAFIAIFIYVHYHTYRETEFNFSGTTVQHRT